MAGGIQTQTPTFDKFTSSLNTGLRRNSAPWTFTCDHQAKTGWSFCTTQDLPVPYLTFWVRGLLAGSTSLGSTGGSSTQILGPNCPHFLPSRWAQMQCKLESRGKSRPKKHIFLKGPRTSPQKSPCQAPTFASARRKNHLRGSGAPWGGAKL